MSHIESTIYARSFRNGFQQLQVPMLAFVACVVSLSSFLAI